MSTAESYREEAKRYRERAAASPGSEAAKHWLRFAADYDLLADLLEDGGNTPCSSSKANKSRKTRNRRPSPLRSPAEVHPHAPAVRRPSGEGGNIFCARDRHCVAETPPGHATKARCCIFSKLHRRVSVKSTRLARSRAVRDAN
jgi:hypothetical protein